MADTNDPIEITAERLLLVEGWDDVRFIERLLDRLHADESGGFDKEVFQVINYQGVTNLRDRLTAIRLTTNNFDTVTHLAILRDMDYEGEPFVSITDALKINNMAVPASAGETKTENDLIVGVYLFPDNISEGMLEDLCLQAFEDDMILQCLEDYLSCLKDNDMDFVPSALPKTKMNTLLATKSLDNSLSKRQRRAWRLDIAVMKRWWPWNNPAFDDLKNFLRELAK